MAHYNLIIFTKTRPERADLDRILAPYEWFKGGNKPKILWDTYKVGGMNNYFEGAWKNSKGEDIFQKADLDLEGMRQEETETLTKLWTAIHDVVDSFEGFRSLQEIANDWKDPVLDYEQVRTLYKNQAPVKLFRNLDRSFLETYGSFFWSLHIFNCPLDDFVFQRVAWVGVPYAYILNEEVHSMGGEEEWDRWIYSQHNPERLDWAIHFHEVLDSLPDDIWMTSLDCHI